MLITQKQDAAARKVKEALKANDGYCPCKLIKDETTRCICTEFLEQKTLGECTCGLYIKLEV